LDSRIVNVGSAGCGASEILVVPGQPSASYLFMKVTNAAPPCGAQMPLGSSLTEPQIQCLSTWITSLGAADGGS
jgi:hypothetical protein